MELQKIAHSALVCAVVMSVNIVNAKCVLPVPDNGDIRHNPPNLEGEIVQISGAFLKIKAIKSSALTPVQLDEKLPVYTAFGGDGVVSELKTGLHVWVWYANCKPVEKGITAKAAYFQVYSFDPNDQPKAKAKAKAKVQNLPPK